MIILFDTGIKIAEFGHNTSKITRIEYSCVLLHTTCECHSSKRRKISSARNKLLAPPPRRKYKCTDGFIYVKPGFFATDIVFKLTLPLRNLDWILKQVCWTNHLLPNITKCCLRSHFVVNINPSLNLIRRIDNKQFQHRLINKNWLKAKLKRNAKYNSKWNILRGAKRQKESCQNFELGICSLTVNLQKTLG